MLQLKIDSHPIRLEYELKNAQLSRETTLPKVEMKTVPPRLEIRQPRGELTIDSTAYYYSVGRKNIADFSRDNAQRGRQVALEAIAATVEEGNRLAQFTNPSNVIADLAFESRFANQGKLSWEPLVAPEIDYKANSAQIQLIPGKLNYTPINGKIDGQYIPGKVNIHVSEYPSLDISVVDIEV